MSQVEAARRAEERLLDGGAEVTLRGESGDPADRIVAVADELDVDAVCVGGATGRRPARRCSAASPSR
ncbi:universal stress protein [Halosegnis marinus]|uniref:universal stress protein n=1 Tax=Halosegnis marinus TaxID=3034023 RepID=UPI00361BA5F4